MSSGGLTTAFNSGTSAHRSSEAERICGANRVLDDLRIR
jgi:hypothetical protein